MELLSTEHMKKNKKVFQILNLHFTEIANVPDSMPNILKSGDSGETTIPWELRYFKVWTLGKWNLVSHVPEPLCFCLAQVYKKSNKSSSY